MHLFSKSIEMWRLIYSKRKLKKNEREDLQGALDGMSFSCGAQLQDADIPMYLKDVVYVRQMSCEDPIEKSYYSAKFEDICVYCAASVSPWSDTEPHYPQCSNCEDKQPIPNAKKSASKTQCFCMYCIICVLLSCHVYAMCQLSLCAQLWDKEF